MRLNPIVRWQRTPAPGFLFHPGSGDVIGLNEPAATILEHLEHCSCLEDLLDRLRGSTPAPALRDDVAAFLHTLQRHDLLQP